MPVFAEIYHPEELEYKKIWANCNLANKKLNWKAKKSINQSMIDAWKWEQHKNNHVI